MTSYISYSRLYSPDQEQNLHRPYYVNFSKIEIPFENQIYIYGHILFLATFKKFLLKPFQIIFKNILWKVLFSFYSALTTSHLILSVPPICSLSMLFLFLSALSFLPECHMHGSCLTYVCRLIVHRKITVMLIYTLLWILSGFCFPCHILYSKTNYICDFITPIQHSKFPWVPAH